MTIFRTIWTDPVWSKVIATAVIAVACGAFSYLLDWWPTIGSISHNIYGFLIAESYVSNWLIGIGIVCAALVLCVLVAIIVQSLSPSTDATSSSWQSYTTDNFFDLLWHWQYNSSSGEIHTLYACCEDCDYQIHPEDVSVYAIVPRILFRCDMCGRTAGPFEGERQQLESKVRRHIQQKLRTGSWQSQQ